MKIIVGLPPVYPEIVEAIGRPPVGAIYTWAFAIFNPSGGPIPEELLVHESVHSRQQAAAGGPEAWWQRYLADRSFRLAQEIEAYRAQYTFVCGRAADRNQRRQMLRLLAGDLSSAMYGHLLSRAAAAEAIKA